jgi:hypothetical protein
MSVCISSGVFTLLILNEDAFLVLKEGWILRVKILCRSRKEKSSILMKVQLEFSQGTSESEADERYLRYSDSNISHAQKVMFENFDSLPNN